MPPPSLSANAPVPPPWLSGAKPSECDLSKCFEAAEKDPFLVLKEMRDERDRLYNTRLARLRKLEQTGLKTGPKDIRLPEYTQPLPGQDAVQKVEALLASYPIRGRSPWHHHHVEILQRHIGNFEAYSRNQKHTSYFDLMLCAICSGAVDLADCLWKHCDSPLRAALIAEYFVSKVGNRRLGTQELQRNMSRKFKEFAVAVLDDLPNLDARRKVLLAVPDEEEAMNEKLPWQTIALLGWPGDRADHLPRCRPSRFWPRLLQAKKRPDMEGADSCKKSMSILDLAIKLRHREFISHSYCTSVLDEMWCGSSAQCGKVRCIKRPEVWKVICQVCGLILLFPTVIIVPMAARLPTKLAFLKPWLPVVRSVLPLAANENYEWVTKHRQPTLPNRPRYSIPPAEVLYHLLHIPLVKQMLYLIFHVCFVGLFILVAFQPLCGPLNATHYIFGSWLAANVVHVLYHALALSEELRLQWWGTPFCVLEVLTVVLLILASFLRVWLDDSQRWSRSIHHASTQQKFVSGNFSSGNLRGDDGSCDWSIQGECLRILLAVAAILLIARVSEGFYLTRKARAGVLLVAASHMFEDMMRIWFGDPHLRTTSLSSHSHP